MTATRSWRSSQTRCCYFAAPPWSGPSGCSRRAGLARSLPLGDIVDRQRPVDLGLTPVFRIGVTGHRNLPSRAQEKVGEAIGACLTGVKAQLEAPARASAAHGGYRRGASATPCAQLRLISSLAEGADRLAARQALDLGAELDAPLPFAAEEYEKDFSDSVADFRQLLSKARVLTLDGLRDGGVAQTESYESAGRFLARNCDLLMAIWDGEPARGRGGTAEIVRYAVGIGVPVWWIDLNGEAGAKLLRNAFDLNAPEGAPEGEAASSALRRLIDEAVTPPSPAPAARSGVFGWIAGAIRRRFDPETTPLENFLDEAPRRRMFPWRAHAFLMSWVLPKSAGNSVRMAAPVSDLERYWSDQFVALDEASSSYAERCRSTYALTAALALIATLAFTALTGRPLETRERAGDRRRNRGAFRDRGPRGRQQRLSLARALGLLSSTRGALPRAVRSLRAWPSIARGPCRLAQPRRRGGRTCVAAWMGRVVFPGGASRGPVSERRHGTG